MEKKLKLGPFGMNIELPDGQSMAVPVLHADIIGPLGNPESKKFAKELVGRYNAHEELIILLKGFLKETSGKKLNIRKDFSLINYRACASKLINQLGE